MLEKLGSGWLLDAFETVAWDCFPSFSPAMRLEVETTNWMKLEVPTANWTWICAITILALGQVIKNTVKLCIFDPCSTGSLVLRDALLQVLLQSIPGFLSHLTLMTGSQSRHCLSKPKRATQTLWQAWWMCLMDFTTKKPRSQLDGLSPYRYRI